MTEEKKIEPPYIFPSNRDLKNDEIGKVYGQRSGEAWVTYSETQQIIPIAVPAKEKVYIGDVLLIWDFKEGVYVAVKVVGHTYPELKTEDFSTYAKGEEHKVPTAQEIDNGRYDFLEHPTLYDGDALGVLNTKNKQVEPLTFAPHSKGTVVRPTFAETRTALGLHEKGIPIGLYMHGNKIFMQEEESMSVMLPYSEFIRHVLLTGTTGVGKTEILKYISYQLAQQGFAVITIDFEKEWTQINESAKIAGFTEEDLKVWELMGLQADKFKGMKVWTYAGDEGTGFSINFNDIPSGEMSYYIPGLTSAAMRSLPSLIDRFRDTKNTQTLQQFVSWLDTNRRQLENIAHPYTSEAIIRCASAASHVFDRGFPALDVKEMLKHGQISVISLQNISHDRLASKIVMVYAFMQISKEKEHNNTPTELVLDEAHRIVPRFVSSEYNEYQSSVNTIIINRARLGRRRYLGLLFATHSPNDLSGILFNLCNTKILLQMSGPVLETLARDMPVLSGARRGLLTQFPKGRGLVFSPTFKTDLIVRFPRSPMYHKQAEKDLDDQIEEYLKKANTSKGGELEKYM